MMKKITVLTLCAMLFALSVSAAAQQPAKMLKLGWLVWGRLTLNRGQKEFVWQELSKLGYVEGKNIVFEYRYADNNLDRLPALADELVRLKVDLIHTGGANAARAAKQATKTIPIIFNNVNDPVPTGLVEAWRGPVETSPASRSYQECWAASDLSCSKRRFPSSGALRCFGIRAMRVLSNNGRRTNRRQKSWGCNFKLAG